MTSSEQTGRTIEEKRKAAGWLRPELARRASLRLTERLTSERLRRIEDGAPASYAELVAICAALGVEPDSISAGIRAAS